MADLSERDIAEVVTNASGSAVPHEDRARMQRVIAKHEPAARKFAAVVNRGDDVAGGIHTRTIDECTSAKSIKHSLTFNTPHKARRILGYIFSVAAIYAILYAGVAIRNGLDAIEAEKTRQNRQAIELYRTLNQNYSNLNE